MTRLPRWYWLVGYGLFAVILGLLATQWRALMAGPPPSWTGGHWSNLGFGARVGIGVVCSLATLWFCWVCPSMDAGERHPHWESAPRQRLRFLRLLIWLPVFGAGIGLAVVTVPALIAAVAYRAGWVTDNELLQEWVAPVALIVVLVASRLNARRLSRNVEQRLRETASHRYLCFQCGFDLRGNPSAIACPECGGAVPFLPPRPALGNDSRP